MAAPATTARVDPVGIPLKDGYSSLIAFAVDSDVSFWEKTVQPPSVDGGDHIDNTTMFNNTWRTKRARALAEHGDVAVTAEYDPVVYDHITAMINVEGSITVHFPDGSTLDFFGFLRSFEPQSLEEGGEPTANIVIVVTDYDPVNNVEAGPVMTEVAGT